MAKRGPPSLYTQAIAQYICAELVKGRSLRSVCTDPGMPSAECVVGWELRDHEGFREQYVRAREAQAVVHADEIIEILDMKPTQIVITRPDGTTELKDDPANVNWLKNRADGRKWIAARMRPKVYGDKIDVTGDLRLDIGSALDAAKKRAIDDAGQS
jgi:hypothetical protein